MNTQTLLTIAALGIASFSTGDVAAAQFVEIDAEIRVTGWPQRAQNNELAFMGHGGSLPVRCVVSTNFWLIEGEFARNVRRTWIFTGTNILCKTARSNGETGGAEDIRTFESSDGNPGNPVKVQDTLDWAGARICWLAFCSGTLLKHEGRRLYPANDIWKENVAAPNGFRDATTLLLDEDPMGLPRSVDLYTPNGQVIAQYRAVGLDTTNVIGMAGTYPLGFNFAQYRPAGTNGWELDFTANGKLKNIRQVSEPGWRGREKQR